MNLPRQVLFCAIVILSGLLGGCANDGGLCGGVTFKSTTKIEREQGLASGSDPRSSTTYY